jgi:hypothetical protein
MATIAEQAQEMANMARRLHRQPITKAAIDAAVAASKPVAVANTPQIMAPHAEGCDCASCVRHRDTNFNQIKTAEVKQRGAVMSSDAHPAECDCADCMQGKRRDAEMQVPGEIPVEGIGTTSDNEEEEWIEEEIHPGIHKEVEKAEGKDGLGQKLGWSPQPEKDGIGTAVAGIKAAAHTGAAAGHAVAAGQVPGIGDEGQHPADSAAHPGFKAVASEIEKKEGVSKERANKILGAHNAKLGIK